MPPATNARAATKAATRDALLDAALAEIAERGLDAPSLDAICARAGYTRGAFYVHFKDRDALLAAVVQRAMDRFLDAMIAHGDRAHDLEETITRFATVVDASGDTTRRRAILPIPSAVPFARVLDAVSRSPRLREGFAATLNTASERLTETVVDGQKARALRRDIDAPPLATVLVALALGCLTAMDAGLRIEAEAARATILRLLQAETSSRANRAAAPRRGRRSRR